MKWIVLVFFLTACDARDNQTEKSSINTFLVVSIVASSIFLIASLLSCAKMALKFRSTVVDVNYATKEMIKEKTVSAEIVVDQADTTLHSFRI